MTHNEIIQNLQSGYAADFIKHLNEGDFSAHLAQWIAQVKSNEMQTPTFTQLAIDELEIEMDSYIDEVESGRRG